MTHVENTDRHEPEHPDPGSNRRGISIMELSDSSSEYTFNLNKVPAAAN